MLRTLDADEVLLDFVDVDDIPEHKDMKSVSGDVGVEETENNRKKSDSMDDFEPLLTDMLNEPLNKLLECTGLMNNEQNSVQNSEQNRMLGTLDADEALLDVVNVDDIPDHKDMKSVSEDVGAEETENNRKKSDSMDAFEPLLTDMLNEPLSKLLECTGLMNNEQNSVQNSEQNRMLGTLDADEAVLDVVDVDDILEHKDMKSDSRDVGVEETNNNRNKSDSMDDFEPC